MKTPEDIAEAIIIHHFEYPSAHYNIYTSILNAIRTERQRASELKWPTDEQVGEAFMEYCEGDYLGEGISTAFCEGMAAMRRFIEKQGEA